MAELTFQGGLNEQDIGLVKPQDCISGYNFELGSLNSHFNPRKPFDKLGTATNAASINGFIQLIKNDNTETTLVQSGDTVYLWNGTSTFTSKGTVASGSKLRGVTWTLGGYSVIVDITKSTKVKKWDGTTFGDLTTGLGSTLFAKYGIVHLGRVWLFNVTAGTDTPHLLVASAYENPQSYDTSQRAVTGTFATGAEAFYMLMPDLKPINGVDLFYGELIVSTEGGRLWKLSGTSPSTFSWTSYYAGSSAIGTETLANIGDDVVYMKRDGVIESVRSTADFGDVKTDDLSRWIRTSVAGLTSCQTIYDQSRQKVYFFSGSNKLFVLFKEMIGTEFSPWSLYKTGHSSSFSTNGAAYLRKPGGSNYYVYWGDSIGNVYQMEGTGANGDSATATIESNRKSRYIDDIEGLDLNTMRLRGRVEYRRIADCDLLMDFEWADDYAINCCTVPLEGPATDDTASYFGGSAYFGGLFYFNTGFQLSQRTSTKGFSPVGRGPGFYVSLTIQSTQLFDVMKLKV
jgi:hypothetical protein